MQVRYETNVKEYFWSDMYDIVDKERIVIGAELNGCVGKGNIDNKEKLGGMK